MASDDETIIIQPPASQSGGEEDLLSDMKLSERPRSPAATTPANSAVQVFSESLTLMDDNTWIWALAQSCFTRCSVPAVRLPSNVTVRHSWSRFKNTPCILIHWESKSRSGGAIIEEILDVDPRYDVANKIIVLTSNPIHEDVVYFSELGVRRIVRIRNREKEIEQVKTELATHIKEASSQKPKASLEMLWRKVLVAIDRLPDKPDEALIERISENIQKLRGSAKPTARDIDAMGSLLFKKGDTKAAFEHWESALKANPNYFRTFHNIIAAHRQLGQHQEAYMHMQKMQMLNRSSITRLVAMGEAQVALNDDRKAEHFFRCALEKDSWCSGALNGMADLKFRQGDLDGARSLLEKSSVSYKYATKLNMLGIEMVKSGNYSEALEHYSKAQYVLPQQEKGPQLFYNIGLCYFKWNKPKMAQEFLKLALVKEPNYKKAQRLLEQIKEGTEPENSQQVQVLSA